MTRWDGAISITTLVVCGALLGYSLTQLFTPLIGLTMLLGVDFTLTVFFCFQIRAARRETRVLLDELERIRPVVELEIKSQGGSLVITPVAPPSKETIQ